MTRKRRRLYLVLLLLLTFGGATALVLPALEDNMVFFRTPSELSELRIAPGERIRLGGLVEEGSVGQADDGATNVFRVTDTVKSVSVRYRGLLPDLFRPGQGVVAEGTLDSTGTFIASIVYAKHDENYMPKEVAEALKARGEWQGDEKK